MRRESQSMIDTPIEPNDPEAYEQAAEKVTAESDRDVWVVQESRGDEWHVAAVLTSYEDAQAYMEDARDFAENCPTGSPERFSRRTVGFRYGGRDSPTKMFESWPPETQSHK